MSKRGIVLALLAVLFVGNALCEITKVPASQDVYISMGMENGTVYSHTDHLLCAVNATDMNGTSSSIYPGEPIIQFDISEINITNDDMAILALKADLIEGDENESALIALLPIGSEWNEESDYTTFLVNILPAWNIIKKNDMTEMSTNTDGDKIFAFDVSSKLIDAKSRGDKMSLLLQAISNSNYSVDFLSNESGQGPYLLILPYSFDPLTDLIEAADENTTVSSDEDLNASSDKNLVLPSDENLTAPSGKNLTMPSDDNLTLPLNETEENSTAKLNSSTSLVLPTKNAADQNLSITKEDKEASIGEMKVPIATSPQNESEAIENVSINQTQTKPTPVQVPVKKPVVEEKNLI